MMRQTVVGGIWVSKLVLHNDLFWICKIFYEHARPYILMFLVVQILFSCTNNLPLLIFCAISKSALLLATVLRTPSHMYAAQPCSTVIEHTPTHKTPFSSSEGHLYICKDKNIKHQILTWLKTCCQNENKFEREFAEISACELT